MSKVYTVERGPDGEFVHVPVPGLEAHLTTIPNELLQWPPGSVEMTPEQWRGIEDVAAMFPEPAE